MLSAQGKEIEAAAPRIKARRFRATRTSPNFLSLACVRVRFQVH